MVDLIYELGGSLEIKNRQGLTPLTLAAVKARKEVNREGFLQHICNSSLLDRCSIIFYKKLEQSIGNMAM